MRFWPSMCQAQGHAPEVCKADHKLIKQASDCSSHLEAFKYVERSSKSNISLVISQPPFTGHIWSFKAR